MREKGPSEEGEVVSMNIGSEITRWGIIPVPAVG
jgi:hypothetical protein